MPKKKLTFWQKFIGNKPPHSPDYFLKRQDPKSWEAKLKRKQELKHIRIIIKNQEERLRQKNKAIEKLLALGYGIEIRDVIEQKPSEKFDNIDFGIKVIYDHILKMNEKNRQVESFRSMKEKIEELFYKVNPNNDSNVS